MSDPEPAKHSKREPIYTVALAVLVAGLFLLVLAGELYLSYRQLRVQAGESEAALHNTLAREAILDELLQKDATTIEKPCTLF